MEGSSSVVLFLAAGLVCAIFALVIFGSKITGLWQTACWSNTVTPFNEKLLYGSMMQTALGNMDKFSINIYTEGDDDKECLDKIYLLKADPSWTCPKACSQSSLDSDTIRWCQEECSKKCGTDKGYCIMLMPKATGWKDVLGWFATRNKPVIYSSGKYTLNFPTDVAGLDKGITPSSGIKCILFEKVESKTYNVVKKDSECNA